MTQKTDILAAADAEHVAAQEETNRGVARATGVVAGGNIASRVLGLAREIVFARLFGASGMMDAFNFAVIVPKAFYDLLIGGHVNSALVPVLSAAAAEDRERAFWPLVSVLVTFASICVIALVLLLELFAPVAVQLVGDGASPEVLALATNLLRLTAPALIFLSLFAVLSGTLYALHDFLWPALAGAVFNAAIVCVTLLLAPRIGITAAAVGWLTGAIAQFALQLPGLRGARLRWTWGWWHPGMIQIALLYAPVMVSLMIDTLVIRVFSYNLASGTGVGSVSYMNWATTLIQFPHGLVATAISIAILPTLSQQATDADGVQPFKDTLGLGLRLAIALIIPATVGLFVLAQPIIGLIFERGAFMLGDTLITALALRLYLVGLPFATLDLLLVYAFYARQDTLTPALIGLLSLGIYMVVAVVLVPTYGLFSLMIADSVKHLIHASVAAYLLYRRLGGLGEQSLLQTVGKTTLAAVVMGAFGLWLAPFITGVQGTLREVVWVIAGAALCGSVYLGLAVILKIDELRWLLKSVLRR